MKLALALKTDSELWPNGPTSGHELSGRLHDEKDKYTNGAHNHISIDGWINPNAAFGRVGC